MCVSVECRVCGSLHRPKEGDLLELELQVVVSFFVWLFGIECRSSRRAAGALNH